MVSKGGADGPPLSVTPSLIARRLHQCGTAARKVAQRVTSSSQPSVAGEGAPVEVERYGVSVPTLRQILITILIEPDSLSRKQVAERLELSSATVTKAVTYLMAKGYLLEDPQRQASGRGRRESPLRINPGYCYVAGVSIRESGELFGVVTDLSAKVIYDCEGRFLHASADRVVVSVANLVEDLLKPFANKAQALGVALGGQIDAAAGMVRNSRNFDPPWEDIPLAKRLRHATGLKVEIENDANSLALFEQWFGYGRFRRNFAVARMTDQGVGFGIVANGELLHGEDGINGELGHAEINPRGPECRCGKRGCLEVYIRAAVAAVAAQDGDPKESARAIVAAGDAMGRVLAQLQLTNACSQLVIGGKGIVELEEFRAAVCAAFERRPFLASPKRVLVWHPVTEKEVAQGAASMLLRHLDVD